MDALSGPDRDALLHYDGEFATAEALVEDTITGRNYGWLAAERAAARRHLARVIREDDGAGAPPGHWSYAVLLRGTDPSLPASLRLPPGSQLDPATASDDQVIAACARCVVGYMRTLHFSRDKAGRYNGSPYDRFLRANRLAEAPTGAETSREYTHRLADQLSALRAPRFIDGRGSEFRFGAIEFAGAKIFFRSAVGDSQHQAAGNCAECHTPPHFTDFKFHNTGATQDEYDALHGEGAFARLTIPSAAERAIDYDRWLQPTPIHPHARGVLLAPADPADPNRADLGAWNVYANPDMPQPQPVLARILNPNGQLEAEAVLLRAVAAFKTPTLRALGESAPYLHTGRERTLEDVVRFYRRMSDLAHSGQVRNSPPEFFSMRLSEADVAPLVAFLRSLNEEYQIPSSD